MKRSPLKRGSSQLRRTPLAQVSRKRASESSRRAAVKREALRRAGHRCELATSIPELACAGPLDADEWNPRGRNPGGHLDVDNVQIACRAHHDWKHANPIEAAHRGLAPYPAGYMGPRIQQL